MSTSATDPASSKPADQSTDASPIQDKGKGKAPEADVEMDEDDDDDEDDDEDVDSDNDEEDEDEAEEDTMGEIDPAVILPRRTRGAKVDYTSAEALSKAGLKADDKDDEDDDDNMKA